GQLASGCPQRCFRVLDDQPALIEVQCLVGQQRDDVATEAAIAGSFGHAQGGEQVFLCEGLQVGVVGAHAGEGCQATDGAEQLSSGGVVVGVAQQRSGVLGEHGDDPRAGGHAADAPV